MKDMISLIQETLGSKIMAQSKIKSVPADQLLAIRSSSTLEDLDKMAGAGLFDSILNINFHDAEQIKKAIIDVWLSLHTKRAIISRKQNKIKTQHAQMAVLV